LLPDKLANYLMVNGITYIKVTPSLFNLLVNSPGFSREACRTLRFIMLGGEPINVKDVERCHNICGHIRMMNHYGPTEATIGAAAQYIDFSRFEVYRKDPTIGAPLDNYRAYILDKNMGLLPEGITGELCIAGDSICLGYLNQVSLTQGKIKVFAGVQGAVFSKSAPWPPEANLYKTGDLACWQPDGHIKLLGRIDDQIKIRGYRIELGGIESQLLKHGDIKDVVVIDRESGGERYICAYVVSGKELSPSQLKDYLAARLPDYMIPSHFVQLKSIPLTAHNKIDRQALPEPQLAAGERGEAPASDIEKKLADIWADVLKVKKDIIGVNSNFFQLGGHSLKVTLAVSRVHRDLNIKLPLVQIFRTPTISELARFIEKAAKNPFASIEAVEKMEYYPLSSAQKRLYVLHRIDRESIGYNVHYAAVPDLDLNKERLAETVKRLIRRHESLRTSFQMVNNEPVQKVQEDVEFEIDCISMGHGAWSMEKKGQTIKSFVRPFDLSKAPLLRMGLIESPEGPILMSDMHHIITDRISMRLFVQDLFALYRGEELSRLKLQYRDYTQWQNGLKGGETFKRQECYWLREFEGEVPVLQLPTDFARPMVQSFEGNEVNFEVGREETTVLKKLAAERETTLYMVLLALFNIMLAKISGQEDIVVGTPVAARRHTDLEQIIGMFVNTLALRNYPAGEKPFLTFLEEVKERTLQAFENQEYPFEELVEKVEVPRDTGRNPLFDVVFSFQGFDAELQEISTPGKEIPGFETKTSKFDLSLNVLERSGLFLSFTYCTKLFKKETIERFVDYLKEVLAAVLADPGKKVAEMQIISTKEKQEILHTFNDTEKAYPKDKTIHQLFEDQATKTPDYIALIDPISASGGQGALFEKTAPWTPTKTFGYLTYWELAEKSGQLAHTLQKKGVEPGTIVGIMTEPSIEMIIGIMGILKAGGAYLPIDPNYPEERIKYMLTDSGTEILLTDLPEGHRPLHHSSFINHHSDNLAYVIYTSGSTGTPNGVMVEHQALVNLCFWHNRYYSITACDRATKFAGTGFDASVWEIFPYLIAGASLYIVEDEIKMEVEKLNRYFEKNKITVAFLPTQMGEQFMEVENRSLRKLLVGGDKLRLFEKRNYELYNNYGPTEYTVVTTAGRVDCSSENIPIGKPIGNTRVYILDKYANIQPIGVPGELCISGNGLSLGYLNNPELTNKSFAGVQGAVFQKSPLVAEGIFYKTGDLARWLPDGNIQYLGRIDNQVKIRGYRIETGEVETRLLKHEGVKEAVVTAVEVAGDRQLCAYIVPASPGDLETSGLREYLAANLPGFMLPSYIIPLAEIPVTPSGKIDRRAVPKPGEADFGGDGPPAAPRNPLEKKLMETWRNVLGRDNVGINDNFFMKGGDSIKAIQVISRMNKTGYKIDLRDLFSSPTISQLAPKVRTSERMGEQAPVSGIIPLTPIQQWFFKSDIVDSHHFNQAVMLYSAEGFEAAAVEAVFMKLQEHHDALRMTYRKTAGGEILQTGHPPDYPLSLTVYDFRDKTGKQGTAEAVETKADELQASIDPAKGPLMKLGLFRLQDGDRLLIVVHHLVIDGISWRILFEDIDTLYGQYKRGEPFSLPLKTDSFKHWAEKLTEYADSQTFLKEKTYWAQLAPQQVPGIKKDFETGPNRVRDTERLAFRLGEEETDLLLTSVNEAFGTEINDILLTALALGFEKQFGLRKLLFALEGHGREDILKGMDTSRTVGWFTSIYPVLLDVSHENDLARQIKEIKETLHRIPNKGIGWGILKYLTAPEHKQDILFNLQPQVSFNYLGQVEAGTEQTFTFGKIEEPVGHMFSPNGQRQYLLDISGIIFDKRLSMSITYNKKHFEPETIEGLKDHYRSTLGHIISFCSSREQKETTPSDFGYKKLSIEELDSLFD
jgi:amino acid adenylation domain-containing protein/non-ribosomal peptide synthase protein (TIGR01720 family)